MLLNQMLDVIAQEVVHPSHRGFVRGRDIFTNVVELEAAVAGDLHDEEAEPAAVLLDIVAAFPSAG